MMIQVIGLLIGVLVAGTGIYYRVKEKEDPESRKIYTIATTIGAIVAIFCLLLLIL